MGTLAAIGSWLLSHAGSIAGIAGAGASLVNSVKSVFGGNSSGTSSQNYSSSSAGGQMSSSEASSISQSATQTEGSQYTSGQTSQIGSNSGAANIYAAGLTGATGSNSDQAAAFNQTSVNQSNALTSLASLANNLVNFAGSVYGNKMQQSAAQEQMAFNSAEAQKSRDYYERLSNTSYQRAVKDMQKAGLNPMLAAYNGGADSSMGTSASASLSNMQGFQSAGLPSYKAASQQAMYEYANNTMENMNNMVDTLMHLKQYGFYDEAKIYEEQVYGMTKTNAKQWEEARHWEDTSSSTSAKYQGKSNSLLS